MYTNLVKFTEIHLSHLIHLAENLNIYTSRALIKIIQQTASRI